MSEFLTAGFTLHFIKDILDKIQTGYVMIDFMITGAVIMCMNRDIRTFLNNYIVVNNVSYFYWRCFHNQIEYRLSSIRKTNYEGSFNICHEKIFSICEYINTRIKNEDDVDLSKIEHFEEFIVNEDDGYCEDKSIMVPIGKLNFENKDIRIEICLQNKEIDEKHGKKTEYKQIEISVYGKNHNKIQDFIDDPNWKCYVDMCNRYGFMIDSNIPWRIVADIGSEGMSTYTAGLGLGTATAVIAAQFRKGYSIDNQLLVKTLLGIYDTVKKQSFQELEVCNGPPISHTIYPETYTAEGLKEKYSPEYFIDLYCRIRFFEEESQFSPDEQASLIDDCLEMSHLETPIAALKVFEIVLNKPFDYRGSLSYIRESNKAKRKLRETENG